MGKERFRKIKHPSRQSRIEPGWLLHLLKAGALVPALIIVVMEWRLLNGGPAVTN